MAPPDRPVLPYSAEDIKYITDPQEQTRAVAELSSFIVRMKQWQKEHGEDARDSDPSRGHYDHTPRVSTPYRNVHGQGATVGADSYHVSRPQRGGYSRGRGGYPGYHPYQRPAYQNRSAVFHSSDSTHDASEFKKAVTPIKNGTHSEEKRHEHVQSELLCPAFTSTGICSRHACRRLHDPDKQAICKTWLFKGSCPKGGACALSHSSTPHNAPTCQHFQEARCTNDNCRFSHVRINPGALNCEAFGKLGYCEKGADCFELHAHECPDFSNTGSCFYGDKCRYGHVRRASRLRMATRRSSESVSTPPAITKEESEDVAPTEPDSETWIGPDAAQEPHQFTQQADFVSLNADD